MAKVTSNYEVSIPKELADQVGIEPGDEIEWSAEGRELRARRTPPAPKRTVEERLASFDERTKRQEERNREYREKHGSEEPPADRGWTREDLYEPPRGLPR